MEGKNQIQNLKEAERKKYINAILETTADGFWVAEMTTRRMVDVNKTYCRMSGYSREEFLKLSIRDIDSVEDPEETTWRVETILEKGSQIFETRHRRKDGSLFDVEISVTYLDIHGGLLICFCRDISGRKQAEAEKAHAHDLLRYIIEHDRSAIAVHDKNLNYIYVSRRYLEEYKVEEKDIIGKHHYEVFPDLPSKWRDVHLRALKGEVIRGEDDPYLRADGSLDWTRWECRPWFTAAGTIGGIIVYTEVITERKQMASALKSQEKLLRNIIDTSHDMIYVKDRNLKILLCNRQFSRCVGKEPEELTGKTEIEAGWDPRYVKGDQKQGIRGFEKDDLRVLQGETIQLIDEPSGVGKKVRIYDTIKQPLKDEDGAIIGILGISRDITDRRRDEASIREERERLAVTLRSIGDGVITTDERGVVLLMNKVAEDLTGWTQAEAQGLPLSTVFPIVNETSRKPLPNPVEKVLSSGEIIELASHSLLISKDGKERAIADSGAPIKDEHGSTIGVVLVFRDVTEKQKLQYNMQRIDKLESLGVLAGGIAHDFNNLLGGIFGYIDMARAASVTGASPVKYLDKAIGVFERARNLTQQLLIFSRGGDPKKKTGKIDSLIKDNASFVLSGTNVKYQIELSQDLWLCDFDVNQMGQVIDNIVINARQAMEQGGKIIIEGRNLMLKDGEIPLLRPGPYLKISFTDSGMGIAPDAIKNIFDPFFTTKKTGNGLGLATCYSIIQKHDGFIDVESIPGKGTTFHIFLPASQENEISKAETNPPLHQGSGYILIMDDEPFMQEIVGDMAAQMGYQYRGSNNGETILSQCREIQEQGESIKAVLLDLTIPGSSGGKDVIRQLQGEFPGIPVFAASGFSEDPIMANPGSYGFTDSIRKPFKIEELSAMLSRHLPGES